MIRGKIHKKIPCYINYMQGRAGWSHITRLVIVYMLSRGHIRVNYIACPERLICKYPARPCMSLKTLWFFCRVFEAITLITLHVACMGHVALRTTIRGTCVECKKISDTKHTLQLLQKRKRPDRLRPRDRIVVVNEIQSHTGRATARSSRFSDRLVRPEPNPRTARLKPGLRACLKREGMGC